MSQSSRDLKALMRKCAIWDATLVRRPRAGAKEIACNYNQRWSLTLSEKGGFEAAS